MKSFLFIVLSVITLTSFISSKSQIVGKINTDCFGATTEAAFDEVTRYSRYKDEAGILRLMSKAEKDTSVGYSLKELKALSTKKRDMLMIDSWFFEGNYKRVNS